MAGNVEIDDKTLRTKQLVVCDLDGTVAESKTPITKGMSDAISEMLKYKELAVIGGGSYQQFRQQFVDHLECPPALMQRVYLFPTCGSAFYKYDGIAWKEVYCEKLSEEQKRKILDAFGKALNDFDYVKPEKVYGEILEDRNSEISFSALGRNAPNEVKKVWDPDSAKRKQIRKHLLKLIPEFEVNIGGMTTIDVTLKGIDKAYGIRKMAEYLKCPTKDMLFLGDAIFEGGNDYPVKKTGVDSIMVRGPSDTMEIFSKVIEVSKGSA